MQSVKAQFFFINKLQRDGSFLPIQCRFIILLCFIQTCQCYIYIFAQNYARFCFQAHKFGNSMTFQGVFKPKSRMEAYETILKIVINPVLPQTHYKLLVRQGQAYKGSSQLVKKSIHWSAPTILSTLTSTKAGLPEMSRRKKIISVAPVVREIQSCQSLLMLLSQINTYTLLQPYIAIHIQPYLQNVEWYYNTG